MTQRSLLAEAVLWNECVVIVALLLNGADPDSTEDDGDTPSHVAIDSRQARSLELLLAAGADLTVRNHAGFTPLDVALGSRNTDCARVLLANGQRLSNVVPRRKSHIDQTLAAFEMGVVRCRAVTRALLSAKKRGALERLDRFVVRLIALQMWATRGETLMWLRVD